MLETKLYFLIGADTYELDSLLDDGWIIKQISASSIQKPNEALRPCCYIWLERYKSNVNEPF